MPLELGVWRIDGGLKAIPATGLDLESRLEDLLDAEPGLANPGWMIVGRQVNTGYGGIVDLVAIDPVGTLIVLELKRDKTPREVIAQVLEYGAWVVELAAADVANLYRAYVQKYHPERASESLDAAFKKRFGTELPEDLNQDHELVVVASQFDASSERIVQYLADVHDVAINAIFFRVFKDGDREYLARAWLRDQADAEAPVSPKTKGVWNEEYYVSFGGDRDWAEARKFGYIAGGGGAFYSRTLNKLKPGARVWVNVPATGYVGVGEVTGESTHFDDVTVTGPDGQPVKLATIPGLKLGSQGYAHDRGELGEYVVPVKWINTVDVAHAVKERGFFGSQHTVAQPRDEKWRHTVERLKQVWGIA